MAPMTHRGIEHREATVKRIRLDSQPEAVRQFVLTLSVPPEGAVLELAGEAVACVVPPPPKPSDGMGEKWTDAKNDRRGDLIDRKYAAGLSLREEVELAGLQEEMLRYRQRVAPLPLADARRLHQQLLAKSRQQSGGA